MCLFYQLGQDCVFFSILFLWSNILYIYFLYYEYINASKFVSRIVFLSVDSMFALANHFQRNLLNGILIGTTSLDLRRLANNRNKKGDFRLYRTSNWSLTPGCNSVSYPV